MIPSRAQAPDQPLSPDQVRGALETILQSDAFLSSPRASQFLRYIVERSLGEQHESLKEFTIGLDVFGRPASFDPRTDTIVRVQARRLRKRLEDYYANQGASDAIVIELPKGSYVPSFHSREGARVDRRIGLLGNIGGPRRRWWIGLAAGALAAVLLVWPGLHSPAASSLPRSRAADRVEAAVASGPLSVPLTSFGGYEGQPDLSPDAEKLAFVWDGEQGDNLDIYIKPLSGDTLERLTHHPGPECCPAWSPDGRRIALLRPAASGADLVVISVPGHEERTLARLSELGHQISWSPDGRFLAVEDHPEGEPQGIFLVSSSGATKRRITEAPRGLSDAWPAFSPDARALAFARGSNGHVVHTLELASDGTPSGAPKRHTAVAMIGGLDWTPDGRDLVFGLYTEEVGWRLWKVRAGVQGETAVPLRYLGWQPSFGRRPLSSKARLVYAAASDDKNIYRAPGPGASAAQGAPQRIVGSSRNDTAPRVSPAGDKIVYVSGRSGHMEVWTSGIDGSSPRQITFSGRTEVGSPSWSPDGRFIGFNGFLNGAGDVYVVEAGGGIAQRRTTHPSTEGGVSWSRDGRWLYFVSDRTGSSEIYKKPAGGGETIRVTANGGHQAVESPDGKWLYYSKSVKRPGTPESLPGDGEPGIFRIPVTGGAEERVLEEGVCGRWALSRTGIYLLGSAGGRAPSIDFYSYGAWQRKTLVTFPKHARFGIANSLTVSEDDSWIIYA
ncbi:MAG: hypothetical protein R2762_31325, partial [Bryobacteraceae bacterium]